MAKRNDPDLFAWIKKSYPISIGVSIVIALLITFLGNLILRSSALLPLFFGTVGLVHGVIQYYRSLDKEEEFQALYSKTEELRSRLNDLKEEENKECMKSLLKVHSYYGSRFIDKAKLAYMDDPKFLEPILVEIRDLEGVLIKSRSCCGNESEFSEFKRLYGVCAGYKNSMMKEIAGVTFATPLSLVDLMGWLDEIEVYLVNLNN